LVRNFASIQDKSPKVSRQFRMEAADDTLVDKYNLSIFEVVKAWRR
jgi:hypothetical protein